MILKDRNAGIFTLKLNVGEHFGMKSDALYIVLREPTMDEVLRIQGQKDEAERITATFNKIMDMIIEHNFESEEGKMMSNKDVWAELMKRSDAASIVSEQWTDNCPLFRRSKLKSAV
jgi:hypothetical protein